MILVTSLTLITLVASVFVFQKQDSVLRNLLKAYVTDMADSYYENVPTDIFEEKELEEDNHHAQEQRMFFHMFSSDPSLRTGGLLLLDGEKRVIGGSEGANRLLDLWGEKLPLGEAAEVEDSSGKTYQMIVRILKNGHYVLVAASQTSVMASMSGIWNFWLVSVMLTSFAILIGITALWKYLVTPIRHIVDTIQNLQWGKETPLFQPSLLFEVGALTNVVVQLASETIDKERLHARYVGDIVRATEEARRRLSRELHDGPLQLIVAGIKHIQLAQDAIGTSLIGKRLDDAEEISQFAAKEVRHYCDELSPSWLTLGLNTALEEVGNRLATTHGVKINVEINCKDDGIPKEYTLSIIRILQEATSNSVRHGKATNIDVNLTRYEDDLVFEIKDNGAGFAKLPPTDYEKLRLAGHRGLSNIHERVHLLNGRLEIPPISAGGCTVKVFLKLKEL